MWRFVNRFSKEISIKFLLLFIIIIIIIIIVVVVIIIIIFTCGRPVILHMGAVPAVQAAFKM